MGARSSNKSLAIIMPMLFTASYWGMLKLILPILPHFSTIFDVTDHHINIMISTAFALSGMAGLIWGIMLDRFKPSTMFLVISLCSLATLVAASISITLMVFSIFFISSCILMNFFSIYSRWYSISMFTNQEDIKQSLSLRHSGGYSAAFIAPYLAGLIASSFGWRHVFIIMIIWIIVVLCAQLYMQYACHSDRSAAIKEKEEKPEEKEEEEEKNKKTISKRAYDIITNKSFMVNSIALSCVAIVSQGYIVSISFWLTHLYNTPIHSLSFYLLPMLIPGMIIPPFFRKISNKYGTQKIAVGCATLFLTAGIIFLIIWLLHLSISWLWVLPGILITICYTGISPILSYRAVHYLPANEIGYASGFLSVLSYFAGGLGIFITLSISMHILFIESIYIMLIALIFIFLLRYEKLI